jgi:NAD-dependent SIR2 family protein deacetylase
MHDEPNADIASLARFVRRHPRQFVLTGAGTSTDSGIPGYRDVDGRWAHPPPMRIDEFLHSKQGHRRYWSRSMIGWPELDNARPNAAHRALATLEALGCIDQLVTQNVDGLHERAGSMRVIELHGNVHRVVCLVCGAMHSRASVQRALERRNRLFMPTTALPAPDGDADTSASGEHLDEFIPPSCSSCHGKLKPDVVFFGEAVPRPRVDAAHDALERADAMLVVGSSLMVYSGYRFCVWAAQMGKPIAAVNVGRTRADALLALKVEQRCGEALSALVDDLTAQYAAHATRPH